MQNYIIWGRNPVMEALSSGQSMEKILIAHDSKAPKELLELAKEKGIKVQIAPRQKLEELSNTKKTQGVIAILSPITYVDEEELFRKTIKEKGFFVVLDHITDPQNVGSIARSVEVFGGIGILIPKDRSAPINPTVVKSSSGAIFHLKISKTPSISKALRRFKELGGWVYSLEKGGKDIQEVDFVYPMCIVLGSEGEGVSKSVLDISDLKVSIPMRGKVTSLNVSAAGAVCLWEIYKRQANDGISKK
ncbi:23S rRNA (guanosine(2251)-2'-O)-methyltransferase RlmB [Hydrogenobaculum acidophilum]